MMMTDESTSLSLPPSPLSSSPLLSLLVTPHPPAAPLPPPSMPPLNFDTFTPSLTQTRPFASQHVSSRRLALALSGIEALCHCKRFMRGAVARAATNLLNTGIYFFLFLMFNRFMAKRRSFVFETVRFVLLCLTSPFIVASVAIVNVLH